MTVGVQDLGIDFMAFSIHKMMGPSGMGGLWGRMDLLEGMRSIQLEAVPLKPLTMIHWNGQTSSSI